MSMLTNKARLILLFFVILYAMPHHTAQAQGAAIGTVTRIQATAMVDGEGAVQGTSIYPGSTLSTGEDGRLEVVFTDKTKLFVGGDSTFIVSEFAFDTENEQSVNKAIFQLAKGAFRMITSELIDASPENFGVITPLAAIGIRGTDFWGGYLSPIELDIVMLEGKGVVITSMGGVVEINEPGMGVSVADPVRHPKGYEKALQPPKKYLWSAEKLARATATVSF